MRNIRKLLLLAVAAIAAMAFVPSVASAQGVEVEREQGGDCPTVVTVVNHLPSDTGCSIHAITEPGTTADLYQHTGLSEVPFSQCQNEFEAAFDRAGHGYIYNQVLFPETPACGRETCDEAAPSHRNRPWEAQMSEPAGGVNQERLTVTFCLYAHNPDPASEGTVGTPCTVLLDVERIGHTYEVETFDPNDPTDHESGCLNLGEVIELEGHWITTPSTPRHRGFEVHHLN